MARAIAICKGGPLDEQLFSVELDEQGSPPALDSRARLDEAGEVACPLYMAGTPADLSDELRKRFYGFLPDAEIADETWDVHEERWGLVAAFEYMPHAFAFETDGDEIVVVAGEAL